MEIPIKNIFFLLCYAWDKLDEGKKIETSSSDYNEAVDLFARVLVNGCKLLFKRGLDRNYNELSIEYNGVKGRINFAASLHKNLFKQGKTICICDEFEYNVIQNQILKATLCRIAGVKSINKKLRHEVLECYWKFQNIDDLELQPFHFSKVKIHRNNSFYDLLIRICRLVFESTMLDETDGKYHFKEFTGNDKAMGALFEAFIRNFYKKEQSQYKVKREDIKWNATPLNNGNIELLPKMQTDVSLESVSRKIIIEVKYYRETLSINYDVEKFHSKHLYQLYSYLRNIEVTDRSPLNNSCEGILLYPTVQKELNDSFQFGKHKICIATVDLSQEWKYIDKRMRDLVQFQ